jgi:hypothetical protein
MVRIAAFAAAPLLPYSPSALAWGGLAHEVICELAFLELNDTARQQVIELCRPPEPKPKNAEGGHSLPYLRLTRLNRRFDLTR